VRVAPDGFETRRLRAERSHPRHLDLYVPFEQDERVARWLGGISSPGQTQRRLERELEHWRVHGFGRWALFDRVTGEFVGRGGFRRVEVEGRPEVELGYAIVPERWGEGLATELSRAAVGIAFDDLGLTEIVAFTLPDNRASRRVMEKAGFGYERTFQWKRLPHVLYRIRSGSSNDG
jgi:ribosomal-protein-alanine N-acetyltransferase